jgi:hypothetical protein
MGFKKGFVMYLSGYNSHSHPVTYSSVLPPILQESLYVANHCQINAIKVAELLTTIRRLVWTNFKDDLNIYLYR